MQLLDWSVLIASLVFIVGFGLWKGRQSENMTDYLLADRSLRWYSILFSIMATQASAITFLSGPGQAYVDGMRFVQFYFGLPIGMVILSITAIPIYHKLKVFTAYEYLESRFDLKTRVLSSIYFLIGRGLAAGLTIFAPALILSHVLGWDIHITNWVVGLLVIVYTAFGGTRAVSWTHSYQMLIIMTGMVIAFVMIVSLIPAEISFFEATHIAGKLGRLNVIDFSFDLSNRYTVWTGIIGGLFLQLSYFGTDQSQVARYLGGKSITESRLGLLLNGIVKIPMQFFILFLGAMLFVFYIFEAPPVFFNEVEVNNIRASAHAAEFSAVETEYQQALEGQKHQAQALVEQLRSGHGVDSAAEKLRAAHDVVQSKRDEAIALLEQHNPEVDPKDTNYIFLSFVTNYMPSGLIGLIIAVIIAASMSSTAGELNALGSTTIVDIYRRMVKKDASERQYVNATKLATVAWGIYAILLAEYASRLGSLIEAVNILGSIFYGPILGMFLIAFYLPRIKGGSAFYGGLAGEVAVLFCHFSGVVDISFLWYNVIGCAAVVFTALIVQFFNDRKASPNIDTA